MFESFPANLNLFQFIDERKIKFERRKNEILSLPRKYYFSETEQTQDTHSLRC